MLISQGVSTCVFLPPAISMFLSINFMAQRHLWVDPNGIVDDLGHHRVGFHSPKQAASEFTPEKWWLEDDPASFWDGIFSGALAVSFREGITFVVGNLF